MDKIEKLKLNVNHLELNQITDKINEITDVLNSRLFESTITVPSPNQKQPEVCQEKLDTSKPKRETIRDYNPEKEWDKYKKSKIKVREFNLIPEDELEKQEEWREEFHNRFVQHYAEDDIYNFYGYGDEAPQMGSGKEDVDDVIDFISQLLSERTEEVLEQMYNFIEDEMLTIEKHGSSIILKYIEECKSKLKEEE